MTAESKEKPAVEFGGDNTGVLSSRKERKEPSDQQQQEVELGQHGGQGRLSGSHINKRWRQLEIQRLHSGALKGCNLFIGAVWRPLKRG